MIESPDKFQMNSVIVEAIRSQPDPVRYDITSIVGELNVFENINIPYLTASIAVIDSAAMSSLINFNGTEKVIISLENNAENPVEMTFFVHSVTNISKSNTNNYVSMYTLNLIEPFGYVSQFLKLRHGFRGNISEIIEDIYTNFLESDIDVERSSQSVKVVIPNLTPLGACDWLKKRASSEFGEPMFLFSSIKGNPQFKSLGAMLQQDPILSVPFLYSQVGNQDLSRKARTILKMDVTENDSVLKFAKSGSIKSSYFSIDPFRATIDKVDFSSEDHRKERTTLYDNPLLDESFNPNSDAAIIDIDSTFFSGINTTSMFDRGALAYDEETDLVAHTTKVSTVSDRMFLTKQEMEIIIPGWYMLYAATNTSIGNIIDIEVPKDRPSIGSTNREEIIDKKRSGRWLISRVRHKFDISGYYVASLALQRTTSEDTLTAQEVVPDLG